MHLAFTTIILESLSLLTVAFPSNLGSSDVAAPLSKRALGYQPGWCGVHVVQYQKNEGPGTDTSVYRFDVLIKDAYQNTIGEATTVPDPASVDSALPSPLSVQGGNQDQDPVQLNYAGQSWASDASTCGTTGGYQDGSRSFNCGFTC